MKTCVDVDENGYLFTTSAEPGTAACTYLITDQEALTFYPFNLSSEDGSMIAAAIVCVWAVGFVVRLVLKMMIYQRK